MSERLRHLQRQQALLREHLAWIESEIARETTAGPAAATERSPAPVSVAGPTVTSAPAPADADTLLERYAAEERQNPADLRRGCFIVFFLALALVIGAVTVAWLLFYR
ncbi:MAG TPA: hypothetical protein VIM44_00880 [Rariglobus sp.]